MNRLDKIRDCVLVRIDRLILKVGTYFFSSKHRTFLCIGFVVMAGNKMAFLKISWPEQEEFLDFLIWLDFSKIFSISTYIF